MSRSARILVVTAGLITTGAVCGAVIGAVTLALGMALAQGPVAGFGRDVFGFGAVYGAAFGAVAAPATAWLLLRRVSLGRAVVWCGGGAAAGGVAGTVAMGRSDPIVGTLFGALAGFLVAVVLLRRRASAPGADRQAHRRAGG